MKELKSVLTCRIAELTHFGFFYLGFLSQIFTIHRTAGEGEAISIYPCYHFHPFHRHLYIRLLLQRALRTVLVFAVLIVAHFISKSLLGNVTTPILEKCLGTFSS